MSSDRREAARVTLELWVEESMEREVYFQRASNLSIGGLFLEGTLPQEPGTVVRVRFTLPGATAPIEARAEIVHAPESQGRGMGLRFVELSEADRAGIEAFVGSR